MRKVSKYFKQYFLKLYFSHKICTDEHFLKLTTYSFKLLSISVAWLLLNSIFFNLI